MYIYYVPKCMTCHKAIVGYCADDNREGTLFHDYMYFMPILFL